MGRGGGTSSGEALREFGDRGRGVSSSGGGGGVGRIARGVTGEISSAGNSTGCCCCFCFRLKDPWVADKSAGSWSRGTSSVLVVVRVIPALPGTMKIPSTSEGWCFSLRFLRVSSPRTSLRSLDSPGSWTVTDCGELGRKLRKMAFSTVSVVSGKERLRRKFWTSARQTHDRCLRASSRCRFSCWCPKRARLS